MTDRLSPAGACSFTRTLLFVFMIGGVAACSDHSPTEYRVEPQFAQGGGGPPVRVTATDPTGAEQGTTLDVRVLGSNFEPGSIVTFNLNGVLGKVTTSSTTFVSSDELVASVVVDATADIGLYDVEVITPRGKKGVGTELFAVREKGTTTRLDPIALEFSWREDPGDAVTNDRIDPYVDGVDDVRAFVATDPSTSYYGDMNWRTDSDAKAPSKRFVNLLITDVSSGALVFQGQVTAGGSNGQDSPSHLAFIEAELGVASATRFHIYWSADPYKYNLRYGTECGAAAERPAEKATVTLVTENPRVWIIESQGRALLCRSPLSRKGKPQPEEAIEVLAPFQMTVRER